MTSFAGSSADSLAAATAADPNRALGLSNKLDSAHVRVGRVPPTQNLLDSVLGQESATNRTERTSEDFDTALVSANELHRVGWPCGPPNGTL